MTFEAGGTISTSNCWHTCTFLLHNLHNVLLLITEESSIICILPVSHLMSWLVPVSHLMSWLVVIVYEKNSKSNEIRIFAQSCHVRWIFYLVLELEQALTSNICLLEIPQISLVISAASLQRKTLLFCFSRFLRYPQLT